VSRASSRLSSDHRCRSEGAAHRSQRREFGTCARPTWRQLPQILLRFPADNAAAVQVLDEVQVKEAAAHRPSYRWVFLSAPFSSTRTSEVDDYFVRSCTQPSVRTWHGLAPVQHESFRVVKLIEHVKLESAPRVPEGLPKSKSVVLSATPAGNALRGVSLRVAKATCFERPPASEHKLGDTRVE